MHTARISRATAESGAHARRGHATSALVSLDTRHVHGPSFLRATDRHRVVNIHRRLEAEACVHALLATGLLVGALGLFVSYVLASSVGLVDAPFAGDAP